MKKLMLTDEQIHYIKLALQTAAVVSRENGHHGQAEDFAKLVPVVEGAEEDGNITLIPVVDYVSRTEPDFINIDFTPSEEMLEIEQQIIAYVESRGWVLNPEAQSEARVWHIEIGTVDGGTEEYDLYIEPWNRRYCAKYNIIRQDDRYSQDLEWDEDQGGEVLEWLRNHGVFGF